MKYSLMKAPRKKVPKSCICKFSQAKLKAIAQRRATANSVLPRDVEKKEIKRESCEPDIPPVQETDFIEEIKPSKPGKSVNDTKGDVSKNVQAWIR